VKAARRYAALIILTAALCAGLAVALSPDLRGYLMDKLRGRRTVPDAVAEFGPEAEERLVPRFRAAELTYPPAELTLIGLKDEGLLELWARENADETWRWIHSYPIQGQSGGPGPKLREGDRQVPEGFYEIEGLNPNSSYHLSMKLNYPNAFDLKHARREGRDQPGSDIFIHGGSASIGCLAMGDPAVEELFCLAARVGPENVRVLLAPCDLRRRPAPAHEGPEWAGALYGELKVALDSYSAANTDGGPV
jgi:hypothetical protein